MREYLGIKPLGDRLTLVAWVGDELARAMQANTVYSTQTERNSKELPSITAFVCANCARAGRAPSSANRPAPTMPDLCWPIPVRELAVPCAGRLQPEHVLKAFEVGADVVCVVGCAEDNCHTIEGSKRCTRRVDYVRGLLDQIGIGGEHLWHVRLPGSAREDMALGIPQSPGLYATQRQENSQLTRLEPELRDLRQELADRIAALRPSPLHNSRFKSILDYPVDDDEQSED